MGEQLQGVEQLKKTKGNKTRLLKRSPSQPISANQRLLTDNERRRLNHVSFPPSNNGAKLFTRPFSSSVKQLGRAASFPRPRTSLPSVNGGSSRKGSDSKESGRTFVNSKPPAATSSPFRSPLSSTGSVTDLNLQRARSTSLDSPNSKRLNKNGSRGELVDRFSRGFTGLVTARNEEEEEEEQDRRKRALDRFRRAVHIVRIFSSLFLGIRRFAEHDKTRRYDLYYMRDMLPGNEDKPTLIQETTITFNKHVFSRDNTLHFPLWARWTCAKSPENRTEAEINKLVTLLRGMKSFGKFSREAQRNLCRTMTYACYERRRLIVRQGHPGLCFYFIVSGSVSVTVTRKDYKTGIYVTNTVDVLEKNDAFGEIALISEEAKRTATIICRERVEVLVVNRETILEHCPDVFQREYEEKIQVLRKHPLFNGWKEDSLRSLSFRSHIREFSYGKLVDVDTTASESIYFVIKGKLEMLRRVDLKAVHESDVTVTLFQDRPLPRPITALPRKDGGNTSYINVGSLQAKDSFDLMTLCSKDSSGSGNILVSAGVRLLKVPKRRVVEFSPKEHLEMFEQRYCPRHRSLTDEEVYRDYLAAQSWLEYRQKVVQSVMDFKSGRFVAHVSSTAKGSSGWTAWPGKQT